MVVAGTTHGGADAPEASGPADPPDEQRPSTIPASTGAISRCSVAVNLTAAQQADNSDQRNDKAQHKADPAGPSHKRDVTLFRSSWPQDATAHPIEPA